MAEPQPGQATPKNFELLSSDDKQKIIQKLKEVPQQQVEKFIYQNKRSEWALTAEATKWIVREMADKGEAIRILGHPKVERDIMDPEWATCSVLGNRVKVDREGKSEMILDSNIGSARSWTKQKLGKDDNAKIVPDEFWYTKVVSKATRNLQQSMIPNEFKKAIITRLLEIKNGKVGGSGQPSSGTASSPSSAQKPQGQPPAGQGAAAQGGGAQGAPPAGQQQGAPPAGGAQKPQNQSQQKPPGGQGQQKQKPSNPNDATIEAVQQHFRAVFIQFAGTEDKPTLQKTLKALTGKTAVTDLERGVMVELGPILRRKIKGEVKWTGTSLHEMSTGEQLWPKVEAQAEPPADAAPETAAPDEIPMF